MRDNFYYIYRVYCYFYYNFYNIFIMIFITVPVYSRSTELVLYFLE